MGGRGAGREQLQRRKMGVSKRVQTRVQKAVREQICTGHARAEAGERAEGANLDGARRFSP